MKKENISFTKVRMNSLKLKLEQAEKSGFTKDSKTEILAQSKALSKTLELNDN